MVVRPDAGRPRRRARGRARRGGDVRGLAAGAHPRLPDGERSSTRTRWAIRSSAHGDPARHRRRGCPELPPRPLREPAHGHRRRRQRRPRAALRAHASEHFGERRWRFRRKWRCAAPEPRHVAAFTEKDTEQYHVCLGGPGPRARRSRPLRRVPVSTRCSAAPGARASSRRCARSAASPIPCTRTRRSTPTPASSAVYFGSREEAVGEAMTLILDELRSVVAQIPEDELERARHHLKGALVLSMESPSSRMQSLGRCILTGIPVLSSRRVAGRHRRRHARATWPPLRPATTTWRNGRRYASVLDRNRSARSPATSPGRTS